MNPTDAEPREHLKGGPNAPHTADPEWLRKYGPPFAVKGDNPPVIVAANGEAILSMMWPVHAQTSEGEQAAVEYVKDMASTITEDLNRRITPPSPDDGTKTPICDEAKREYPMRESNGKVTWFAVVDYETARSLETRLAEALADNAALRAVIRRATEGMAIPLLKPL